MTMAPARYASENAVTLAGLASGMTPNVKAGMGKYTTNRKVPGCNAVEGVPTHRGLAKGDHRKYRQNDPDDL